MHTKTTDILVIGGGPVGLFTVFQAGVLGLKTELVDSLNEIGGQCTALYPEKFIYDIPGHPKITAKELVHKLSEQSARFSSKYHMTHTVTDIKKNEKYFVTKTDKNLTIQSKAILIAAGAGAFDYNKIQIPGIDAFEGHSLLYSVKNKDIFYGKNIAITGGGDSAVDWAIILSDIARKVYLVHRRDKFRCMNSSLEQIKILQAQNKIEIVTPYQIKNAVGENNQISRITLSSFNKPEKNIDVDFLLAFFGLKTYIGNIKNWGINLDNNHILVDKVNYSTNIEGIYAIGDICTYPGKLKLILSGFAESATACHDILQKFFHDRPYNFQYSTNMKEFEDEES